MNLGSRLRSRTRRTPEPGSPAPSASPVGAQTIVAADPVSDFWSRAQPIERRHRAQTEAAVAALARRYEAPVFGTVPVWDLVQRLGQCVDPTDCRLFCASQLTHVLQVLEGMAQEGISDPDLLLTVLIHDLGKLLLLTDEDPANVVCMNTVLGHPEPGAGLDRCTLQWNHDEFAYQRFRDLVPDHVSWLVRYHSIDREACRPFMDDRDRAYDDAYLSVFARYDHETKTPYLRPSIELESYRELIDTAFPRPIAF